MTLLVIVSCHVSEHRSVRVAAEQRPGEAFLVANNKSQEVLGENTSLTKAEITARRGAGHRRGAARPTGHSV